MRETLAGFIHRVGEILREGKIPEAYMDVSGLFQLARGNPAVQKAVDVPVIPMPVLPPAREPNYYALLQYDGDEEPSGHDSPEEAWDHARRLREIDPEFELGVCQVVPIWIGDPIPAPEVEPVPSPESTGA